MGLSINFPKLSRNIELIFKEKICELSLRDGELGGASVHSGLTVVVPREACQSAAEPGSSLRVGEKGEELRGGGVLTEGFDGQFDGEARPAAMKGKRQW
jgi:hypothetical protein